MGILEKLNAATKDIDQVDKYEDRLRMELSIAIQAGLHQLNMSVGDLAKASKVTHQHLLRILHDDANPTFRTVAKIASAMSLMPALSLEPMTRYDVTPKVLDFAVQSYRGGFRVAIREGSWMAREVTSSDVSNHFTNQARTAKNFTFNYG